MSIKIKARKPSPTKSMAARTKGKYTRAAKRAVIPGYGKKGAGWAKNPKRAAKNAIYHRTTTSVFQSSSSSKSNKKSDNSIEGFVYGCFTVFAIVFLFMVMCSRR